MNIPNILTTFRMFLIPVFILIFFSNNPRALIYSLIIFLLAGTTDILDGYLARKYNQVTKYGVVLDPLADKLMLLTVLFCLSLKSLIPSWIFIIVSIKEISMIISGILLYKKDTIIPSNIFGKASTVLFYISILALSLTSNYTLLYLAVISGFIALLNYVIVYFKNKKMD